MADTNTTVLDLLLMEIDSHENDWGDQTNANLALIARAIGATVAHAVTTGTVTLSRDNVKDAFHRITGTLVGNVIIEVPATEPKTYFWRNETTGNFTVTVKVSGQTGAVIPQGDTKLLRCNGTDVLDTGLASSIAASGIASWVGTLSFAADAYSSAVNAYLGSTLRDGLRVTGHFDDANATATPTYNYASTGAKTILHADGTALSIGDIVDGMVGSMVYKSSTDKWYLQQPSPSLLARRNQANTFAEDKDQTFAGRIIQPVETLTDAATIAWDMAARPNNVKVVLTATRALGQATNLVEGQKGTLTILQDGTGGWNLTLHASYKQSGAQTTLDLDKTANTRTVYQYEVIKNSAGTAEIWLKRLFSEGKTSIGFYKEYDLGVYSQTDYTTAHGLGRLPAFVQLFLRFRSSEFGFTTGQRYDMAYSGTDDNQRRVGVYMDTTNVIVDGPASNVTIQRADSINMVGIISFITTPNLMLRIYE